MLWASSGKQGQLGTSKEGCSGEKRGRESAQRGFCPMKRQPQVGEFQLAWETSCSSGLGWGGGHRRPKYSHGLTFPPDSAYRSGSSLSYPGAQRKKAALSQSVCAFPRGHCSQLPGNWGLQVSPGRLAPGYLGLGQAQ